MTKKYILDYWRERDIVLALSQTDTDLFAIGKVLDNGGEEYIHINLKELLLFLKEAKA